MVSSADPAVSRRDFAAGETGRGPFIPTNRASNPRAGQWTNAMSLPRISPTTSGSS